TATLIASPEDEDVQFAPVSIGGFTQFAPMYDHVKSHVQIQDIGTNKLLQVNIYSQADTLLVAISDLLLVDASVVLQDQSPTERTAPTHRVMRLHNSEAGSANFSFISQLE
ncbi:hypothetical protein KKJ04_23185, partial [Xenorhabdus bovienii]|uniref:hypothetical protein n=1 Tax=Xenorhabdus bovienii TaxID=40576 RepID=UPI0023B2FC56